MLAREDTRADTADRFLQWIADPNRSVINAEHICIVVAHPDDETIGCGAQLQRLKGVRLVLVTDGAPRNLHDARAHGFDSAQSYAAARAEELHGALAAGGARVSELVRLDIPDQQAAQRLVSLTRALADAFASYGVRIVLTHAYEGGHPDHDATAFAVHAAVRMTGERTRRQILEMPFYRAEGQGGVAQQFVPYPNCPEVNLRLSPAEQARKREMIAAHATQQATLAVFTTDVERFRAAPSYDFAQLPNHGHVRYDQFDWGTRSNEWLVLTAAALDELGLEALRCG